MTDGSAPKVTGKRKIKSDELAQYCAQVADSKKAEDILVLKVGELTYVADFFVICTARNPIQARTITEEILRRTREDGFVPVGVEGEGTDWVLLDYADVVVHIFSEEARRLYDLELLWGDAPRLKWEPWPSTQESADTMNQE